MSTMFHATCRFPCTHASVLYRQQTLQQTCLCPDDSASVFLKTQTHRLRTRLAQHNSPETKPSWQTIHQRTKA